MLDALVPLLTPPLTVALAAERDPAVAAVLVAALSCLASAVIVVVRYDWWCFLL